MAKITRILFRGICVLLFTHCAINLYSQQTQSVLLRNDILVIRTEGIAYLGSGITEDDAKTLAINDAKRNAMEQAGTYLESHTTILNYRLVKDEIITYTGGLLKVKILSEKRTIVNDMFALKIEIEAAIDIKLLNERVKEIRSDSELKRKFEAERERNKRLEEKIAELQSSLSTAQKQEVREVVDALSAYDWVLKGDSTEDLHLKISYYTKAIELDPKYARAFGIRGVTYERLLNRDEALRDYNEAIKLDPTADWIINWRGGLYSYLGSYNAALRDFNKAIELNPNFVGTYCSRGDVYTCLGKNDEALMDYNKAIKLDPEFGFPYYKRGDFYFNLHNYNAALKDYNKAIELDPNFGAIFFGRGCVYYVLGDTYSALADLTKAIGFGEKKAYYIRGLVYRQLNQGKMAVDDFNQYLRFCGDTQGLEKETRTHIKELGYTPKY